MFFKLQTTDGIALYEQVVRQVTYAVATGSLRPGDRVPSVRELARDLAINPNTVARAFRALQDARVLESVRGQGMAVAAGAERRCRAERLKLIRERLRGVLAEAARSGLGSGELQSLVDAELEQVVNDEAAGNTVGNNAAAEKREASVGDSHPT